MTHLPFAKKSLGQHWLTDPASLEAMCEAAKVKAGDTVLEIGPGTGTLTRVLLDNGAEVVAVERDERLAKELNNKMDDRPFYCYIGDILTFDLGQLEPGYKVVANIPYYLTSNLVRVLSESSNQPAIAVLLVQKEVAQRIAAKPGQMSILGVTAQYYWTVSLGREVPAELFTPPPKVDSQIVVLKLKQITTGIDTKVYFRLVKAGFSQKRKTLANSLGGGLHLSREQTTSLLQSAGIDPGARAQTLSLDDWVRIYEVYNSL